MTAPRHAVLAAVRSTLADLPDGTLALVACSGGTDSVALAAAAAEVAGRVRAGAVVVDHGLQVDSVAVAAAAAATCARLGLDPVTVVPATVAADGSGPEAAARTGRYRALAEAADSLEAACVLLGHTADDQAETVLLGLARGSGARALAGMPARRDRYRRPLLGLPRATVRAAYPELPTWDAPHNADLRFRRSRVRHVVLPVLAEQLGPGVAAALARSADQVRDEVAAVDAWAALLSRDHVRPGPADSVHVAAGALSDLPSAVVARVLIDAADGAGVPRGRLTAIHVAALVALVCRWRGQGPLNLPGGVTAARRSGTVVLARTHDSSRPETDRP